MHTKKVKEMGAMKFIISGKNIEVTESIKAAIEEKLGRLDKYLVDDTVVNVTLSVQKGRQKIEVTIPMKGHIIRAEEGSEDMYVSCLLYTSPSPRDPKTSRMPSSA